MIEKEIKLKIIDYIKINHRQTHLWLKEHIAKKFGVEINPNTIRTWKRLNNCLTDRKGCQADWIKYIRANYLKHSDKELATILINKFKRPVSYLTVRHLRKKYLCFRPKPKKYRTVKEVRKCLYCGSDIKITCRNPKQKFCRLSCFHKYSVNNTNKRNLEIATPDKVKTFFKEWYSFINKVIFENKGSLHFQDVEEVKSDCIQQIPSLVYWLEQHNYKSKQRINGYIAETVKNCIRRKLKKVIQIQNNEIPLEWVSYKI